MIGCLLSMVFQDSENGKPKKKDDKIRKVTTGSSMVCLELEERMERKRFPALYGS